jgi:hypothetical protein
MVSAGNVTEATPSALTGGNAFTVTWDSSGTAATAASTVPATAPADLATAPADPVTAPADPVTAPAASLPPAEGYGASW